MTLGPDVWETRGEPAMVETPPACSWLGATPAGWGGRARPQEGGQLGGGQAQLLDEAKVLQRGQRDRLQRPPARQPRDLEHVEAVPVLQLRAARGAARSWWGPTTAP